MFEFYGGPLTTRKIITFKKIYEVYGNFHSSFMSLSQDLIVKQTIFSMQEIFFLNYC
jgi:hypothetical protein